MGLVTVFSQVFSREEHPIVYISRKLTPTDHHNDTVKWEALFIILALNKLHYFLIGHQFTLITDLGCFQWLAKANISNSEATCWLLSLLDFLWINSAWSWQLAHLISHWNDLHSSPASPPASIPWHRHCLPACTFSLTYYSCAKSTNKRAPDIGLQWITGTCWGKNNKLIYKGLETYL